MSTGGRAGLRGVRVHVARSLTWVPPTSTEIGVVLKSGLAAGVSWAIALALTDLPAPALAPLTAIVVVQLAVRSSIRTALQRSVAVVLGVLLSLAIGNLLTLDGLSVGLLVIASLGVTQLLLRMPAAAARQVPLTVLLVVASGQEGVGQERLLETVVGAAVGVVVSLAMPASRLVDARQTVARLADGIDEVLVSMAEGLAQRWVTEQSEGWRHAARLVRDQLAGQAREAVGNSREAARWNVRDRRHVAELAAIEDLLPRLERTAIGAWVLARGVDDHARLAGRSHEAMPAMGALLGSVPGVVHALVDHVLDGADAAAVTAAVDEASARRARCVHGAARRAREAMADDDGGPAPEGEWLGYVALLVQVDRIVADLAAHLE